METKRILILCGGKFAFPAIQTLGLENFLCGVGIGKGEKEMIAVFENESESNSDLAFKSFPNKRSLSGLRNWIDEIQPDFIFSISFPFLLSEEVLSYGEDKFINFHPGSLPEYRGPMPLFETLRNQEKETAISVHFMDSEFDEGPVILKEKLAISTDETYGELAVKLSELTAMVALNMAQMLQFASSIPRTEQDYTRARFFDKPERDDTFIQWKRMSASKIISLINACNPWNQGADTVLMGKNVKLLSAAISDRQHTESPGKILELTEAGALAISCLDGEVIDVQIVAGDFGIFSAKKFMAKNTVFNYSFN